jgi:hypothetical protein
MMLRAILFLIPVLAVPNLLSACDDGGKGPGPAMPFGPKPPSGDQAPIVPDTPPAPLPGGGTPVAPPSGDLARDVAALRAAVDGLTQRVERLASVETSLAALRREVESLRAAGPGAAAGPATGPAAGSSDLIERFEAELSALRGRITTLAAKIEAGEEPDFRTR